MDPSTHERYIFNHFTITISDKFSKKDPMFLVKEMDSVPFQLGKNISFSFKLYISHFDNPPPESDHLSLIIFICSLVTIISVVLFFLYFKSKGISITVIHLTDLWRIDFFFQNTILLSSTGITYVTTILIFLFFNYTNSEKDFYRFTNVGILCNGISSFLFGWTAFYMSRQSLIPEFAAIELIYNSFTILPFIAVSLFNKYFFNSFVGIGLFKSIFITIGSFSISFLVSSSFYSFGKLFFEKKLTICPREERNEFHLTSLCPSLKNLLRFTIYGFIFFFILKPAVDHCFLHFIDDYYFDPFFVASYTFLYFSIISLLSLFNGYKSINKFSNSWQTNHMTLNLALSAIFLSYLLIDILLIRNYTFNFETLLYCGAFSCCFISALALIGMGPSFYTNFIFFSFVYQSSDRNEINN